MKYMNRLVRYQDLCGHCRWVFSWAASLVLAACAVVQPSPTPGKADHQFTLEYQAGHFTVLGVEGDMQAIRDVAEALNLSAPQIRRDLDLDYQEKVTVELFPDQDSLDEFGMNPRMQGYYAYSGESRIQMVSPRNPMPRFDTGYSSRVMIAVHEFVHIVNTAINPDMPSWMNEGVAIYIGPHDIYSYVCEGHFPFEQIPSFADMQQKYESVPAGDLFAFALVDYIVSEYDLQTLNQLIRAPIAFEDLLGVTQIDFEERWHEYMDQSYSSQ
jgi:hypothetical protein